MWLLLWALKFEIEIGAKIKVISLNTYEERKKQRRGERENKQENEMCGEEMCIRWIFEKLNIYGGLNFDLCDFAILFVDATIIDTKTIFYFHFENALTHYSLRLSISLAKCDFIARTCKRFPDSSQEIDGRKYFKTAKMLKHPSS